MAIDESNVSKNFNRTLEETKNNRKTSKPISVKSRGKAICLYPPLTKLVNSKTMFLKKLWIWSSI